MQLVSAGGDSDTQASAATVYESVLLGANGGAMTHAAVIPLVPALADALAAAGSQRDGHGRPDESARAPLSEPAGRALTERALAAAEPAELRDLAQCTLSCWQHSILDFLSCMGIDDIQKTSGNAMAITMTADWVREVDALATAGFGALNAAQNRARVAAEPAPPEVAARYRVSALLGEREPGLPLPEAARVLADGGASYHIDNSSRALNADFLDVIYRMAAGELPRLDDFFVAGDHDEYSLDRVGLRLSRASVAWSLRRLNRDPALLDYVSLAVPRGFLRPGAAPPRARVTVHGAPQAAALVGLEADERGGFEARLRRGHPLERALEGEESLWLRAVDAAGRETLTELGRGALGASGAARTTATRHGASGQAGGRDTTVLRASADGAVTVRRDPRGGLIVSGAGVREPIWHGPVCHASTSLGAASEDYLIARIEGSAGLTMTSSGEGGPLRLAADSDMRWESLQAASGHFGITGADLRRVRDVEIKINQGAKPGKGGRLAGAKVTPTVSKARNIPVGTDALSPDPKHDIYSIEDMPAEVWLWLLYRTYCGIKITGSNYTRYVAAGMWSNFVVDYLLIDAGTGGSGNYHGDSAHVGWPDAFRTILHTHHALMGEQVDLDGSGRLVTIRDGNGAPFGAAGGTRLLASGGLRGELDMLKVLIAGADGLVEGTIGKAAAFGCTQCGNCHLDCPRGGITTKHELTVQNDRDLMRRRMRNWTALNMVKLAVLVDALNRESGALGDDGAVARPELLHRRHPPAARAHRPARDAGLAARRRRWRRRGRRCRRRRWCRRGRWRRSRRRAGERRERRPGGRPRLVPGGFACRERAGHGRRHLGGRPALVQRRQQPRRRHRLRRLCAAGGARPDRRHDQHHRTRSPRDAPRDARPFRRLPLRRAPTAPSLTAPSSSIASTSSSCRCARATAGPTAGVTPTCARTPATSPCSSSTCAPRCSPATAAGCSPATAGCSARPSTPGSRTRR